MLLLCLSHCAVGAVHIPPDLAAGLRLQIQRGDAGQSNQNPAHGMDPGELPHGAGHSRLYHQHQKQPDRGPVHHGDRHLYLRPGGLRHHPFLPQTGQHHDQDPYHHLYVPLHHAGHPLRGGDERPAPDQHPHCPGAGVHVLQCPLRGVDAGGLLQNGAHRH